MKTLNAKTKIFTVVTLLLVATVGAAFRARAQNETLSVAEQLVPFGMLGITRGQTARLNVSNLTPTTLNDLPAGPSRVEMGFVDGEGNPLLNVDGRPIRRVVMLEPGRSAVLQINANNLIGRDDLRLHFRPLVQFTPPDGTLPPGAVIPTLEVSDNTTGKTALLYPGVVRGFNPQPDPPRE